MKTIQILISGFFAVILVTCCPITPYFGLATIKEGRSRGVSSHALGGSNADRLKYIRPGETVEIFNVTGTGVINHIWLTFNEAQSN